MNIFGAFTFGSLIKTFLPGLVWLVALGMLEIDLAEAWPYPSSVKAFLAKSESSALVLAIPASILLGLSSNIIVFMGLNDLLVRNPVRMEHHHLFSLHEELSKKIRETCWMSLGWSNADLRTTFETCIDPEIILVERIGVEELSYVREQYWYHLEFQLNLMLSLFALFLALVLSSAIKAVSEEYAVSSLLVWFVVSWVVFGVCCGLVMAARKNYARHIAKMASLMTALLSRPSPAAE